MKYLFLLFAFAFSLNVSAQDVDKLREVDTYDDAFEILLESKNYDIKQLKSVAEIYADDLEGFKQFYISQIVFPATNTNDQNIRIIISELSRISKELEELKKKE